MSRLRDFTYDVKWHYRHKLRELRKRRAIRKCKFNVGEIIRHNSAIYRHEIYKITDIRYDDSYGAYIVGDLINNNHNYRIIERFYNFSCLSIIRTKKDYEDALKIIDNSEITIVDGELCIKKDSNIFKPTYDEFRIFKKLELIKNK
jgi:hypothetical protein